MDEQLKQSALDFHQFPVPGKIQVSPNRWRPSAIWRWPIRRRRRALPRDRRRSVGSLQIHRARQPGRGDFQRHGGLGNIGALAGKPVMEGKGVLFKKFSGIDVFDIEVDEHNPDKLIDIIAALEPTFGGINLEDIKAPECFYIEQKLRERMKIPVFHDDQHGTAIITTAAVLNGLRVVKKNISDVRLVVSGAGAASIACLNLLVALGLRQQNITVCDSKGVIYKGRDANMEQTKAAYAIEDNGQRTLGDAIPNADIFLGCSGPGVLTQDMVKTMARDPLIGAGQPGTGNFTAAGQSGAPDAIICTGRSDYPNQVNNVLCFRLFSAARWTWAPPPSTKR